MRLCCPSCSGSQAFGCNSVYAYLSLSSELQPRFWFFNITAELQHDQGNTAAFNPSRPQATNACPFPRALSSPFRCGRDWTSSRGAETAWIPFSQWPRSCSRPGPTAGSGSPDLQKAGWCAPLRRRDTSRTRSNCTRIRPGQETQDRRDGFHPTSASFSSQEACCHASASTRSFLTLTSISLIGRRTDRRQLHHLILFLSVSTLFLFLLGIDMASPGYQEQGLHPRRPTTLIRRLALSAGEWWNCSRFAGGVRRYIEMVHLSFTIPSLIAPLQPVLPPLLFFGFPSFHSTSTA